MRPREGGSVFERIGMSLAGLSRFGQYVLWRSRGFLAGCGEMRQSIAAARPERLFRACPQVVHTLINHRGCQKIFQGLMRRRAHAGQVHRSRADAVTASPHRSTAIGVPAWSCAMRACVGKLMSRAFPRRCPSNRNSRPFALQAFASTGPPSRHSCAPQSSPTRTATGRPRPVARQPARELTPRAQPFEGSSVRRGATPSRR